MYKFKGLMIAFSFDTTLSFCCDTLCQKLFKMNLIRICCIKRKKRILFKFYHKTQHNNKIICQVSIIH